MNHDRLLFGRTVGLSIHWLLILWVKTNAWLKFCKKCFALYQSLLKQLKLNFKMKFLLDKKLFTVKPWFSNVLEFNQFGF